MIVFDIKKLEDFMLLLSKRVNDEIYFAVQEEVQQQTDFQSNEIKVILHFLGKIDSSRIGLYQTSIKFPKSIEEDKIYTEMKKVFEAQSEIKIKLISGRISELIISIS
ncbi:MAG: hypothetical protein ACTSWY_01455 [Promethearchaeota archaeon]